ncbi:MAG: hypothetical protein AM324_015145 [Candidatus Thorarchaeota archaeon SMTZ1-83]
MTTHFYWLNDWVFLTALVETAYKESNCVVDLAALLSIGGSWMALPFYLYCMRLIPCFDRIHDGMKYDVCAVSVIT